MARSAQPSHRLEGNRWSWALDQLAAGLSWIRGAFGPAIEERSGLRQAMACAEAGLRSARNTVGSETGRKEGLDKLDLEDRGAIKEKEEKRQAEILERDLGKRLDNLHTGQKDIMEMSRLVNHTSALSESDSKNNQ